MSPSLTLTIFGEDKNASAALGKVGAKAQETQKHLGGVSGAATTLGGVAKSAGGLLSGIAGGGLIAGIAGTTAAFSSQAAAVKGLMRVTGENVGDASRLRSEMQMSGVSADSGAIAMKKLSVNLATAGGTTAGTAKLTKELGMSFKDAHGNILPMSELIPKLADKFKGMADGPAKTALAVKLFGKNGTDMIPMLNKGADGLAEMGKKSDALGLTLNQSSLTAMGNAKSQSRDMAMAMQGLTVTIGGALLPIVTALTGFFTKYAVPAIRALTGFFVDHQKLLMILVGVVAGLVAAMKVWSVVSKIVAAGQAILNAVMAANPIALIVIAIGLLVAAFVYFWNHSKAFRDFWIGLWNGIKLVFETVWKAIQLVLSTAWKIIKAAAEAAWSIIKSSIINPIQAIWDFIVNAWNSIGSFLSGLWSGISTAASSIWAGIKSGIITPLSDAWSWIQSTLGGIGAWFSSIFSGAASAITDAWSGVSSFFQGIWDGITSGFDSVVNWLISGLNVLISGANVAIHGLNDISPFADIPDIPSIPGLAKGGALGPGLTWVGERGPELLYNDGGGSGHVFSNSQSRAMTAGGGAEIHLHLPQGLMIGTAGDLAKQFVQLYKTARRQGQVPKGALAI